jgi:HAD superfamily hydrolase (TIGR01509 family)
MDGRGDWTLTGRVAAGVGRGAGFTALPWARAGLVAAAGIDPHPGTLNLRLDDAGHRALWAGLAAAAPESIAPGAPGACGAACIPVRVSRAGEGMAAAVPAAIVVPRVTAYPDDLLELVSPVALRASLGVADGERLRVRSAAPPPVDAVIFDVDGTLVDSIGAYVVAAARASAPYGLTVDDALVRRALNDDVPFWPLVVGQRPDAGAVVAALGLAIRRVWPEVLATHVRRFPAVADTLRQLSASGLRLGICTASRGESFAALAGLLEHFGVVVTAADVARPKPDPEGLLRAAAALGVAPARAAYIGDAVVDVRASRAAGMYCVGVLSGAGEGAGLAAAGADRLFAPGRVRGA